KPSTSGNTKMPAPTASPSRCRKSNRSTKRALPSKRWRNSCCNHRLLAWSLRAPFFMCGIYARHLRTALVGLASALGALRVNWRLSPTVQPVQWQALQLPFYLSKVQIHMEKTLERVMYASRWLLAPIYLGLSLTLIALGVKFFQEVIHVVPQLFTIAEADLVLVVLALIDLALVGGLIVMVMLSSYENFVSRLDIGEDAEKLSWLGTMDAASLKNKVASSIVAISSIHLLKLFMRAEQIDN